jgi:membrane-bound lytic murein transglycosylase D
MKYTKFITILLGFFLFFELEVLCTNPPDSIFLTRSLFRSRLDSLTANKLYWNFISRDSTTQRSSNIQAGWFGKELVDSLLERQVNALPSVLKISYDWRIRYYIDLLIREKPDASRLLLGLSENYQSSINPVFKNHGIPDELAYLPSVGSGFDLYSSAANGNSGIWRISFLNGKLWGLEINSYIDERKDLMKSTDRAASYLQELYNLYHDWTLAVVAFNSGPFNVNKAIRRANGKSDFWSIYPFLPIDTRDDVPAFIAFLYLKSHHGSFGIMPVKMNLSIPADTFYLSRPLKLDQVSKVIGVPMDQLLVLNPRYTKSMVPVDKICSPFFLPANYSEQFRCKMDSIFLCSESISEYNNKYRQSISTIQNTRVKQSNHAADNTKSKVSYTVKSGDNLGSVAAKYHVTVSNLKIWNNLKSNQIKVSQKLLIYLPVR